VQLRAEVAETKTELQRLKEWIFVGTPAIHKNLSLISLIPKWSVSETEILLEEFLSSIKISGRMGLWQDADKLEIAILRLNDVAKQFCDGYLELHATGVTCQKFEEMFRHMFRDTHTDQYHFMRLQTARHPRNESTQEFAVGC
jgi:hypothetical protein